MKIGLIGCGGMGKVHATALAALNSTLDVEVVAHADKDPRRLEQVQAIWPDSNAYGDGITLLSHQGLDAVHICVPTYLHRKYAVAAMERGLHVLIEKPVCLSPEDENILLNTQKKTGVQVMVGQVVRFFPEYMFLKEAYDTGRYGKLKSLTMHRLSPTPHWGWENWFTDPQKSGTVFFDLHIHDADFVRYLLGEPLDIRVEGCKGGSDQPVQMMVSYDYGCDLLVTAEGDWSNSNTFQFQMGFRANFESATMVFDSTKDPTFSVCHNNGEVECPLSTEVTEKEITGINVNTIKPYISEIEYFACCILENKPIEKCILPDAIQSVQLVRKEMDVFMRRV